jgi:pilus assembly protein CpaC
LTVAEPRLSCRSGGHARFVAGGEIPVPIVNSVGSTDVEFREYGVILDIKPVVDTPGIVMLRVETEISQVDNAQRVAGIPGLLKRRSTTDIDLKHGDTVVIAGLMQRQRSRDTEGLPGVSRLPAVGRLFGVKGQRHEESEVVIFLTPRLESATARSDDDAERLRRAQERIDSLGLSPRKTPERPAPARSSELKGV